jgi:hypothetical protein
VPTAHAVIHSARRRSRSDVSEASSRCSAMSGGAV